MRCPICERDKLSGEFYGRELTASCDHEPLLWCAECLGRKFGDALRRSGSSCACPVCEVALSEEERRLLADTVQRAKTHTQTSSDVVRDVDDPRIRLVFLNGDTVRIPYSPEHTIPSLKSTVEARTNVSRARIVLVHCVRVLRDLDDNNRPQTLGALGIGRGEAIRVAVSPYTIHAGQNRVAGAQLDQYGNAQGSAYDLGQDGAFEGTVVVLQLYTSEEFTFREPQEVLQRKGFRVLRYADTPPEAKVLERDLDSACQLWIISDYSPKLQQSHLVAIKRAFDRGIGVYIWGDNKPYYADANIVAALLLGSGAGMDGNTRGDQLVGVLPNAAMEGRAGCVPNHPITTGIANLYEGVTIATVNRTRNLIPMVWGSAGNLVTAAYDTDGKRLVIDGGFTRLFCKWDTAGTARFVANVSAWLYNFENCGALRALRAAAPIAGADVNR